MTSITEQEAFWKGDFGNDYVARNRGPQLLAANLSFFSNVLKHTHKITRVLEIGANIGLNMMAIRHLLPGAGLSAVEINEKAASELKKNIPEINLHLESVLEFQTTELWDLVFTKGVLIHINPDKLSIIYDLMYHHSSRYILISEYYNPTPSEVTYRGHEKKLFKRDFAGEMLESFPNLSLVDYGFIYHRDANFPQDDMNWFLMEKKATIPAIK